MGPEPRRTHRSLVLAALVAALVVIAAVFVTRGGIHRGTPPAATARFSPATPPIATATARPASVAETILARHVDGDGLLDFEGVLELFSHAVTPLPGVTVPAGDPDPPGNWGELALDAMPSHFDELSPAQRDIVLDYYRPAPGTTPITVDLHAAQDKTGALRSAGHFVHAALLTPPPAPNGPPLATQVAIGADIRGAIIAEGAKLGHVIGDPPTDAKANVQIIFTSAPGAAWIRGSNGPLSSDGSGHTLGPLTNCTVFVGPAIWANWGPTPLQIAQIYHEVFHCYQAFVTGHDQVAVMDAMPMWVREGGADWAASSITGFDEPAFRAYLTTPARGLAQRTYDGVGLFFQLEYLGRPLWPAWWQVWTDASVGPWPTANWFNHIAGPQYNAVSQSWGSSFYKQPTYGQAWDVTAAHQTATNTLKPDSFTGGQQTVAAVPYATSQMTVAPQPAGTEVIIAASSPMRLIDGSSQELVNTDVTVLCWDNCSCPNDSELASSLFHVKGPVNWAMTALAPGGQAEFMSLPIGVICKAKKTTYHPPPPNPCPVSCPGSNGDPHLVTVDLRRLEFQAAGEFTLLRSSDGRFEVQVRQEPFANSTAGAAINTAVAVRVRDHRVSAYLKGDALETHVDGKVVTSTASLGGDGRFVLYERGFEAEAADGSSVWGLSLGKYGINLIVLPSAALADRGVGVLAHVPPGAALPPLPDGKTMPYGAPAADEYEFRYGPFAQAWRVTDQSSLFDYDAGKSTASYTVAGFIPELGSARPLVLDPVARASAESACGSVSQVELRNACVFDVTVTGQHGFVSGYRAAETFARRGATAATDAYWGPKAGAPAPAVNLTAGATQLMTNIIGMSGSVLAPDGAVYAAVTQGTPGNSSTLLVAIDPGAGKVRAQAKLDAPAGTATGVAMAGGSVWVVASSFTSTGRSCKAVRLDPATLAVQATIPLQVCPSASPAIAASDGGVWVQQPVGGPAGNGELWRIDPSTNQVAAKIAVPTRNLTQAGMLLIGGELRASPAAVFWRDGANLYRLRKPWTTVEDIAAARGGLFVVGETAVVETRPGRMEMYGGALAPVGADIIGYLAGADTAQIYVSKPGSDGSQLWREPLSGGPPSLAAAVTATVAPWLASADDPRTPLWFTRNAVLTVVPRPAPGGSMGLYLVVTPLR